MGTAATYRSGCHSHAIAQEVELVEEIAALRASMDRTTMHQYGLLAAVAGGIGLVVLRRRPLATVAAVTSHTLVAGSGVRRYGRGGANGAKDGERPFLQDIYKTGSGSNEEVFACGIGRFLYS